MNLCCECCCDIFGYICNSICCEIFGCKCKVQNQDEIIDTERSEKGINLDFVDPIPSISVQAFPFFKVKNGSFFNHDNNRYSIFDNGDLKCKFSIIGKKKIYFVYAQAGQFECGVIIQSEFQLNNNAKYNYMLANMGCVRNESCKNESCIILSFFKDLNSCSSHLLNGQVADSFLISDEIIKPENYIIPFNLILCTTDGKQIEMVPENTEEYRNSQNGLKFLDAFARKCDKIQIPKDFKVAFIVALNKELDIKKEIRENDIEQHWREYAETVSLPRSPNLERRPIKTRNYSL
jgi:hypothetical protein